VVLNETCQIVRLQDNVRVFLYEDALFIFICKRSGIYIHFAEEEPYSKLYTRKN